VVVEPDLVDLARDRIAHDAADGRGRAAEVPGLLLSQFRCVRPEVARSGLARALGTDRGIGIAELVLLRVGHRLRRRFAEPFRAVYGQAGTVQSRVRRTRAE